PAARRRRHQLDALHDRRPCGHAGAAARARRRGARVARHRQVGAAARRAARHGRRLRVRVPRLDRRAGLRRSGARLEAPLPAGWAKPKGYANGIAAQGTVVAVGGQVGWNPATSLFETDDFVGQVRQVLTNIVAVLAEAGAGPEHLVRLTW